MSLQITICEEKIQEKNNKKKRQPYVSPAIEEDEKFEALALACSKQAPSQPFNCPGPTFAS